MPERRRSASPRRGDPTRSERLRDDDDRRSRKKLKSGGFKWKDQGNKKEDNGDSHRRRDREGRDPRREEERADLSQRTAATARVEEQEEETTTDNPTSVPSVDDDIAAKFGASAAQKFASKPKVSSNAPNPSTSNTDFKQPKPKKERAPVAPSNQSMILVFVNDRLGTKAQIPCLASDSVKDFKMLVANRIGRQPHEIMIKRQGERPFKDILTLADYGVSNGVQLDLELDTGD